MKRRDLQRDMTERNLPVGLTLQNQACMVTPMSNAATYSTPEVLEEGDTFVTLNEDGTVHETYTALRFFEDEHEDLMVVVGDGRWIMFSDVRVAA